MMNLSYQEIERRKPVWLAMSEFYLDTELEDDELARISHIFKDSGYSIQELRDIDYYEVAPIVGGNLMSIAGIWDGFDQGWLWGMIITHQLPKGRPPGFLLQIKRTWFDVNASNYWKKIRL